MEEVAPLLAEFQRAVQTALGPNLAGIYLTGSLVHGDFDPDISDIDLVVITHTQIEEDQQIKALHENLAQQFPFWAGRVETLYVSKESLKTFRTHSHPLHVISPGEPFHRIEAGKDWLMNWYLLQTQSRALQGPPPEQLVPKVDKQEFIESIKAHAEEWPGWLTETASRPYQAYAILTLCRALYATRTGVQPSKLQAAIWAAKEMPEWASLIEKALEWRRSHRDPVFDPTATLPQVKAFAKRVVALFDSANHGLETK